MKIKLFTHTDLDGISCGIVGKLAFDDDIDIVYCDYHNINELVIAFINSSKLKKFTHIFITDISVNEEVAKKLDEVSSNNHKVVLLDHHATAKWLEEIYDWATVKSTYEDGTKTAGTTLFLDYIKEHFSDNLKDIEADVYAEIVRRYDTWDWVSLSDDEPKKFNDLFKILGRNRFIKNMIPAIKTFGNGIFLSEYELSILELYQEQIDRYIYSTEKKMIRKKIGDHNVGIVFADQHISELGNKVCERNPDIDYVLIINTHLGTISLRTIRDDIHVGNISKELFNGGGHQKAAGAQLEYEHFLHYTMDYLLNVLREELKC